MSTHHNLFPAEKQLRATGREILYSDLAAVFLAFVAGGVLAWAVNIYVLDDGFQKLLSKASLRQFLLFAALAVVAILWLDQKEHYRQRLPHWEMVGHVLTVCFAGLLVGGFIQFALKEDFSRLWLAGSWIFFGIMVFWGRGMVRRAMERSGEWHIPVLLIGKGPTAEAALRALHQERHMGYRIAARLSPASLIHLSEPEDWLILMEEKGAGYILLALEGSEIDQYRHALHAAVRAHLPYAIVPPWLSLPSSGLRPHTFFTHDVVLIHNTNRLRLALPRTIKRSFDVVVATTVLLCLLPLFVVVALMVRRDGGPAFIANRRIGRSGRGFDCYKFRSMVMNNAEILTKHLATNPEAFAEWQEYQKLKNDPRITPFGHFIRKTSIDELPQLINVIKGDMSLVGPRPILPGQEIFYGDDFTFYTVVRPGITGPWQVSGRNKLTFERRVALEFWYARNWSLWMDIVILLKTIPVLLRNDQAF